MLSGAGSGEDLNDARCLLPHAILSSMGGELNWVLTHQHVVLAFTEIPFMILNLPCGYLEGKRSPESTLLLRVEQKQ